MKPKVYILKLKNDQYYVGSTNCLERRLNEHNLGIIKSTKYKIPAKIVFHQEFSSLTKTRKIEYKIKKQKSRKIVEEIISKDHTLF